MMIKDPYPLIRKQTFLLPPGSVFVFRGDEAPITSFIKEDAVQQYRVSNGEVCREEILKTRIIINED